MAEKQTCASQKALDERMDFLAVRERLYQALQACIGTQIKWRHQGRFLQKGIILSAWYDSVFVKNVITGTKVHVPLYYVTEIAGVNWEG